jgi:exopolysaccharide production protein ExoZ
MNTNQRTGFLPRLESLRGLAAVSVVGYHVYGQFIDTNVTGMAPVVMFFVLSGFVLARSLEKNANPFDFFRHRVFRLVPAAAAVVLLLTFLYLQFGFFIGYQPRYEVINVFLNALMIRHDINGVMWSLTVEGFATPLILWTFLTFRRWGTIPLLILIAVLFGLSFVGAYVHLLGGFTNLAPLYAFVIGVMLHFRGRQLAEKLTSRTEAILALAAIALFCFCGSKKQTAPMIMLECASSAALVMTIAFRDSFDMFRILDTAIVRTYGRISYSFYLLHPIGMAVAIRTIGIDSLPSSIAIAATTILAVTITTSMAWLLWRWVEVPFIAFGKWFDLGERRSATPDSANFRSAAMERNVLGGQSIVGGTSGGASRAPNAKLSP